MNIEDTFKIIQKFGTYYFLRFILSESLIFKYFYFKTDKSKENIQTLLNVL